MTKPTSERPKSMIRAMRHEILIWKKVNLAKQTGLSERTIANVDDLDWVSENTGRE